MMYCRLHGIALGMMLVASFAGHTGCDDNAKDVEVALEKLNSVSDSITVPKKISHKTRDLVASMTTREHAERDRSLWARAIELSEANPGMAANELIYHLDASDYLPLVLAEAETVRWRRNGPGVKDEVLDALNRMDEKIASARKSGKLSYGELLDFMDLHDGMMSTNGQVGSSIREHFSSVFPSSVAIYSPQDISIAQMNTLWSSWAAPIGSSSRRGHYDGGLIDYYGSHDTTHVSQRMTDQMPQLLVDLPRSELAKGQELHASALETYRKSVAGGTTLENELAEMAWFNMDHEDNKSWKAIFQEVRITGSFQLADSQATVKRRLKQTFLPSEAVQTRIFIARIQRNGLDGGISSEIERKKLADFATRAMKWYLDHGYNDQGLINEFGKMPENREAMDKILKAMQGVTRWIKN